MKTPEMTKLYLPLETPSQINIQLLLLQATASWKMLDFQSELIYIFLHKDSCRNLKF